MTPAHAPGHGLMRATCFVQGLYYAATGLWPLFHMPSFVGVTGPKTDLRLVRMVGALAAAIGAVLLRQWWAHHADRERTNETRDLFDPEGRALGGPRGGR